MACWAVVGIRSTRVRDGGQRRIPVTEAAAIDPTDGNAAREALRRTWWTPHERLRYAMLAQAFTDLRRAPDGKEARGARLWLANDDAHWPLSFLAVCEVLGLDPEAVRARAAVVMLTLPKPLATGRRRSAWLHAAGR